LIEGDVKLDVEVDGEAYHRDPDGFRKVSDQWRDHQIRGLGWKVLRFWVYELRDDMERCVDRIVDELGRTTAG
jgi:very-short-patch-repair endonuclease